MKFRLILCLTLVLGGVSPAGSAAAQNPANSLAEMFARVPPITNADPSVRHPVPVRTPTKLNIERSPDTLSVTIDTNGFDSTNFMVGANMITGVESKLLVYAEGERKPTNGGIGLEGGLTFNLGVSYWHAKTDNIPLPGKRYVVEMNLTAFETDIPAQHMWDPQGSKNYKVLWRRTLKQTVGETTTFMPDILKKIERQFPELGSLGRTNGTASPAEAWNGEEYASGSFFLLNNPRYPPRDFPRASRRPHQDLRVIIGRYASSGDAQHDVEKSLKQRPAAFQPGESYKGATLYRYLGASGAVMTAICRSDQYVIEISASSDGGSQRTMRVLDVVLAELDTIQPSNAVAALNLGEDAKLFFKDYLAKCGTNEIRCLWFLQDNPTIGMEMTVHLNEESVYTAREVYNWARQASDLRKLSHPQKLNLEKAIQDLPASDKNSEFNKSVSVSIRKGEKVEVFQYDRRHAPSVIQRIYDLGGGYFYDGND